jgi:hypothetical protein
VRATQIFAPFAFFFPVLERRNPPLLSARVIAAFLTDRKYG